MDIEYTRLLLGFICGYFLTVSGSLVQISTNNKLASPSTLGFDGAGVVGIIFGKFLLDIFNISIDLSWVSVGFVFLCAGIWLLYLKNSNKGYRGVVWENLGSDKIILIGLSFNLFVGAIFSIVQFLYMAMNIEFPASIWFGSFKQYGEYSLYFFISLFILTQIFLRGLISSLEIINIGNLFALGLGVNVKEVRLKSLLISFILTGVVISHFGVFSFLGLVFPHILRSLPVFKNSIRKEILIGPIITGAIFAVLDQLCYQLNFYGAEAPVGMLSGVIGAGILLVLILKSEKYAR